MKRTDDAFVQSLSHHVRMRIYITLKIMMLQFRCPKLNPLIGGRILKTDPFTYDISFTAFRIGDTTRLYIFCEVELCISEAKCHKVRFVNTYK